MFQSIGSISDAKVLHNFREQQLRKKKELEKQKQQELQKQLNDPKRQKTIELFKLLLKKQPETLDTIFSYLDFPSICQSVLRVNTTWYKHGINAVTTINFAQLLMGSSSNGHRQVFHKKFKLVMQVLSRCTNLQILRVSQDISSVLNDEIFLQVILKLKNLKIFQIVGAKNISEQAWCKFVIAGSHECLNELLLDRCDNVNDTVLQNIPSAKWNQLKKLHFSQCTNITDLGIEALSKAKVLSSLMELNLAHCKKITNKGLEEISCATFSSSLQNLNIMHCEEITYEGMKAISSLPALVDLNVSGCRLVMDRGVEELSKGKGLNNLRSLNLNGARITDKGIEYLAKRFKLEKLQVERHTKKGKKATMIASILWAKQFTNQALINIGNGSFSKTLHSLNLNCCMYIEDEGMKSLCSHALNIQNLSIEKCRGLTDNALESIANLPNLKRLNISYNTQLTDKGLEHLSNATPPIITLHCSECPKITSAGVLYIAQLRTLNELVLRKLPELDDKGLEYLATLPKLTLLNLSFNKITDTGVDNLGRLTTLRELWLYECNRVTVDAVHRFIANVPDIQVLIYK